MASEELDRLIANLRQVRLPYAAAHLEEHLQKAASLKLGHLAFLARVIEAEVVARAETGTQRRIQQAQFSRGAAHRGLRLQVSSPLSTANRCSTSPSSALWTAVKPCSGSAPRGWARRIWASAWACAPAPPATTSAFARANDLLKRLWAAMADNTLDQVLDE
jgi:hypothetical protein